MRAGFLVAIAGCMPPPMAIDAPVVTAPSRCDPTRWAEAATSTHHAWLVSAAQSLRHRGRPVDPGANLARAPLTVLDVDGDDVLLADVRPGAIVARWSPRTALGRAVIRETLVSSRAGVPGDPAVRVAPGYPLAAGGTDWIAIAPAEGVSISGWVPTGVRGTIWEDAVQPPTVARHDALTVLSEPHQEAAVLAGISAAAPLRFVEPKALAGGWYEVTIATSRATIHGFVQPPPPRPETPSAPNAHVAEDSSEIEISQPEPHLPYPIGTCLRDAPNGTIVGMVRGPIEVTPVRELGSWHALVMPTVWGNVTLYADGIPAAPPAVEPPVASDYFQWSPREVWREGVR